MVVKKKFDNAVQYNIRTIIDFLTTIHKERDDLMTKMYELYRENAGLEKMLQMSLLRLLSVQEISNSVSSKEFEDMTRQHQQGHDHVNQNQNNDAYK